MVFQIIHTVLLCNLILKGLKIRATHSKFLISSLHYNYIYIIPDYQSPEHSDKV